MGFSAGQLLKRRQKNWAQKFIFKNPQKLRSSRVEALYLKLAGDYST